MGAGGLYEFSGPVRADRFCAAWPRYCALASAGLGSDRDIWSVALMTGNPSSESSLGRSLPQLRTGEDTGV